MMCADDNLSGVFKGAVQVALVRSSIFFYCDSLWVYIIILFILVIVLHNFFPSPGPILIHPSYVAHDIALTFSR